MKYIIIAFLLFVLKADAQVKKSLPKEYDIQYAKANQAKGYIEPKIYLKVYDSENREYFAYSLTINSVVLNNKDGLSPYLITVIPDSSIMINCIAFGYKIIKLPKIIIHKGYLVNITVHLREDDKPIVD